ncbi:MAG TPA: dihydrolipoamide acetyltransferase family protein [Terracidiphilus sp.]|nr:dihydrolipoamide acetyltransferase family protein [Terracidiphilus sp.]
MAQPIVMSSFGSYAADGKLIGWLKPAGTKVEQGEAIAEIETEKATYELEAPVSGILHPIAMPGVDLPLESVIGFLLEQGETPPNGSGAIAHPPATAEAPGGGDGPENHLPAEVRASPIARRLAREHEIDLARISGSGPGGRIVEGDVMAAVARLNANSPSAAGTVRNIRMRLPLTGMRGTIARRMRQSLATAASLTITREVDAEALVAARKRMQVSLGPDLPYDALFVKIFADSLSEHPELNAVVEQDAVHLLEQINIGFAVAVPGGLLVPVVHNAASMPLAEIVRRTRELRGRALAGGICAEDVSGGTATVSNLGAHGVDAFTPILNPPESVVLGVGRIAERAVIRGGRVAAGSTIVLSLTFDHRVADGVPAAQLLEGIALRISDPHYFAGQG